MTFASNRPEAVVAFSRMRVAVFSLLAFLLCLAFPMVYLKRFGPLVPFDFLANDTFYYLSIANNSHGLPFFSFDGVTPTNGFHPLWQYLLGYLGHIGFGDIATGVTTVFLLSVVLVSIAIGVNTMTTVPLLHRPWLLFPWLVPGMSWMLLSAAAPDYFSVWSFANGMETPLSLCLFAGALWGLSGGSARHRLFGMIFLSLAVLARLDDVFLLIAVGLFIWRTRADMPRTLFAASLTFPVIAIAGYLAYNRATVGIYLPSSGAAKAGFALIGNLKSLVATVLPITSWDKPTESGLRVVDYSVYAEIAMREFQMFYPAAVCLAYLALRRRGLVQRPGPVFSYLAVGILIKCVYNLTFVGIWSQGHWYFAVSLVVSNLLLLFIVDDTLKNKFGMPTSRVWPMAAAVMLAVSCGNLFVNHKTDAGPGRGAREVYVKRDEIRAAILATGNDKFIEFNDGELAWATRLHAASGLGLALDPVAQKARQDGQFLHTLYDRGYRVGVASGSYASFLRHWLQHRGWEQGGDLWGIKATEFKDMSFREIPISVDAPVVMFELTRSGAIR